MKYLKYNFLVLVVAFLSMGLTSCSDTDPIYVHSDNIITAIQCCADRYSGAAKINGTILEYDSEGNLLEAGFTPEQAAGGSGVIEFIVPLESRTEFDLTSVYLRVTGLPYDAVIYPSLTYGRHNILVDAENPDGLVIAVQAGTGEVRKYRIMGVYAQ